MKTPSVPEELLFLTLAVLSCVLVSVAEGYMEVEARSTDNETGSSPRSDITCWTCPNKTDNEACNDWAPDVQCPLNHTICKTVHRLDMRSGRSVGIHKTCAQESQCTWDMVGCYETDLKHVMECISCCNYAYCNEPAPFNHTSALELSASVASHSHRHTGTLLVVPGLITGLWTFTNSGLILDLVVWLICGITSRTVAAFKKDYLVH